MSVGWQSDGLDVVLEVVLMYFGASGTILERLGAVQGRVLGGLGGSWGGLGESFVRFGRVWGALGVVLGGLGAS